MILEEQVQNMRLKRFKLIILAILNSTLYSRDNIIIDKNQAIPDSLNNIDKKADTEISTYRTV